MDNMSEEYSFSYTHHYKGIKEQVASGQLQMPPYDWNTVDQLESYNYESNRHWHPFTDQHNILIHVERIELKHAGKEIEEYRKAGVDFKTILLLRNPFNNFASLWQSNPSQAEKQFDLWKQIAREFLGYTNYLGDKVFCIYDLWFTSENFRKNMSYELGVEWDDSGLNTITYHGESHFEGKKAGQDLKVLERWRHYLENYNFRQLFDEEMVELWNTVVKIYKEKDVKGCLRNGLELFQDVGSDNK